MNNNTTPRPPIVAVMGHIDHGKSTLLDYIRKTNIASAEVGGITQHLSAYEISVPYQGTDRSITFLDTPGHAAFTGMRERGADVADIAILVVSAEDGVKTQTIEALNTIKNANIPYIVAINKIDRPAANIERTKQMLAENEVLVEGYGGTTPWVAISALEGTGIPDLLESILLVSDMEEFSADPQKIAEGLVIESNLDPKRGITATIIIKDGTLKKGNFVVAGNAIATTRIMENFLGKNVSEVKPSGAVRLIGFDSLPEVGLPIQVFEKKKDAEKFISNKENTTEDTQTQKLNNTDKVIPIVIKTDVFGTSEAIEKELKNIEIEGLRIKIIGKGIGAISENDIRLAQSDKETIILGFNVDIDPRAKIANENIGATVQIFNIIYKLTEWLFEELEKRRPLKEVKEIIGRAKVLKVFSQQKDKQVLGCRVEAGIITHGAQVNIIRRDFNLATGKILELQQAKQKVKEIQEGEYGMMVESKTEIAGGDILEVFNLVTK